MKIKHKDFDGQTFWLVGETEAEIAAHFKQLTATAHAHRCMLRQVPQLGQPQPPYMPASFKVEKDGEGLVSGIVEVKR